jgi:hypothetical protein
MIKKIIYVLLLCLVSCEKDPQTNSIETSEPIENEPIYFKLSKDKLDFSSDSAKSVISIMTNTEWSIDTIPNWINSNITSGNTDTLLTLSISANVEDKSREGMIVFNFDRKKKTLTINQNKKIIPIELLSHSGSNNDINFFEPISLLFNRPIKLLSITGDDHQRNLRFLEEDIEYFDNNCGVKFKHPFILGKSIGYSYSVKDYDDNYLSGSIQINEFFQKIDLESHIKNMVMDNNDVWIMTSNTPDNYYEYNSYCYKLIQDDDNYKIDFKIRTDNDDQETGGEQYYYLTINPYNDLVYIPAYEDSVINVYFKNGVFKKSIKCNPYQVYRINFTSNGKGVVRFRNSWGFIDSSKDDVITEAILDLPFPYHDFGNFFRNFDNSKIYMMKVGTSGSTEIHVYDGKDDSFDSLSKTFGEPVYAYRIVQNELNDKMFVLGLYDQKIVREDGSYKSVQSQDQAPIGDFAYNFGENLIFLINTDGTYLSLEDYGIGETIFSLPLDYAYNWTNDRGIATTKDGKYIITYSSAQNQVIIYTTDMFVQK